MKVIMFLSVMTCAMCAYIFALRIVRHWTDRNYARVLPHVVFAAASLFMLGLTIYAAVQFHNKLH